MNWIKEKSVYLIAAVMVVSSLFSVIMGDMTFSEFMASENVLLLFTGTGLAALFSGLKNNQWLLNKKTHINTGLALLTMILSVIVGDVSVVAFLGSPEFAWLLGIVGFSFARTTVADNN